MNRLRGKVVVVTGASSGIGRSAALLFAEKGANVLAAARRGAVLEELAGAHPDKIEPVVADVTDPSDVVRVRDRAVESHGRIDVWINNAGVVLFSTLEEAPIEDVRRVFETNVFGYVYGMKAALEQFRKQSHGVLINNASILGRLAIPYVTVYNASKFAIRGLTESVRHEVNDARDIHVCLVEPGSVDTPIWQHGANYTGKKARPLEPMVTAEDVAKVLVQVAHDPEPERVVGVSGTLQVSVRRFLPRSGAAPIKRYVEKKLFLEDEEPPTTGNLFDASQWSSESGGWKSDARPVKRVAQIAGVLLSASAVRRLLRR